MRATLVRRTLGNLVPPKIATPSTVVSYRSFIVCFYFAMSRSGHHVDYPLSVKQAGGSGASMATVVDFYSKLPKGPAVSSASGIKARYFNGKNASGAPILVTIGTIFLLGYTIDYQSKRNYIIIPSPANFDDMFPVTM
jgi:F-type H+-transporting ATPase subunit f